MPTKNPLRAARTAAGLTQQQACAVLGCSPHWISRRENGAPLTVADLVKLATLYRVAPAALFAEIIA